MTTPLVETARKTMLFSEIVSLAIDSFRSSKVRFALTALGMVIGTGSLIVMVTIGLTGKQYVLNQIQGMGANLIYTYYEGGGNASVNAGVTNDPLTVNDMKAVEQQVPGIQAASPMLELPERIEKRPMPRVEIIDMREEFLETRRQAIFSRRLRDAIAERLASGEQVMLLLPMQRVCSELEHDQVSRTAPPSSSSAGLTRGSRRWPGQARP